MISAELRAAYELQATACLAAAERHHERLLAVAVRRAGSQEAGKDLYQQTVLNCHDAIQRNGFAGERYEFYLLASLKNLAVKERKAAQKWVALASEHGTHAPAEAPADDARAHLAQQLTAEVRSRCDAGERITLRLHADGYSFQDIADMTGAQSRWHVRRQLDRLKSMLRAAFQQAWDGLTE